ncbi:MAG TPA: GNAT family N-acetyltransferase [Promineifilum sp.]|nr:GNAT family N-acetyltransferase [Promineifilum sp.]
MSVIIRPMQPADLDDAKRVILSVAAPMFGPDDPEGFIARWWTLLTDVDDWPRVYGPPRGTFLVALDGERFIGTGAIRPLDETTAELKRLWLLEAYHGRGIGYRITQELLAFARAAGYQRVWLITDRVEQGRAIRFYERLGFHDIPPYNDSEDTMFMELLLSPEEK